ncbi:hypothetical protein CPB85DRAFT_1562778 [Mucidula mucida]|nr:hypothetical protein CPB85DRAFT_1562778 [Mucidula mucida]
MEQTLGCLFRFTVAVDRSTVGQVLPRPSVRLLDRSSPVARYAMCYSHYHCPQRIMPDGDALYLIAVNYCNQLKTLDERRLDVIDAATGVLVLSQAEAADLRWYRSGPYY